MSVAVTSYVLNRTFGNQTRKLIMISIADFASDAGEAFPSIDTLAHRAECSRRSVQEHLAALEKAGELVVRPNAGPRGCNLYRIVFRKSDAPAKVSATSDAPPQGGAESAPPVQLAAWGVQISDAQTAGGGANERRPSAPEPSGTVIEPSGKGEGASAPTFPTPSAKSESAKPEPLPAERVMAELATVWPDAPRSMTGAELHALHGSLRVLDELTAEDWQACASWVVAPNRVRGCALWPRSRSEFVEHAGEAVEKIRSWWRRDGRRWAKERSKPTTPRNPTSNSSQGSPPDMEPTEDAGALLAEMRANSRKLGSSHLVTA